MLNRHSIKVGKQKNDNGKIAKQKNDNGQFIQQELQHCRSGDKTTAFFLGLLLKPY